MFRNMVTSLLRHERIKTTTPKAKELKRFTDKFITLAKKGGAHHRRIANRDVKDVEVLNKLFGPIAERYKARAGGYTRIVKIGRRAGDAAEMAMIELVDRGAPAGEAGGDEKAAKGEKAAKKTEKAGKAEKPAAEKKTKKKAE